VSTAVADALAQVVAEDWLGGAGGGDDEESPIEPGDLDAILETFFEL